MVIESNFKCIKLKLPNNKVVDILSSVLSEMYQWIQDSDEKLFLLATFSFSSRNKVADEGKFSIMILTV